MTTEHAPKTAALIAHAEGLLSEAGQGRIGRHLAKCEVCRRELAAIRAYEDLAEQTRNADVPEIDFAKMEGALAREAARVSETIKRDKRRSPYYTWGALALAAAALLAFYVAWPGDTAPPIARGPVEEPLPEEPAPVVEIAYLHPVVTLAAGDAHKVQGQPLQPGDALAEGDHLQTGDDGVLHVALAEGVGFVADARTGLELIQAREDSVEIALSAGRTSHTIHNGSRYVILAAGYTVEARGTRFVVSYLEDIVGVDVAEGSMLIRTPEGREIELTAPGSWRSSGTGSAAEVATVRGVTPGAVSLQLEHPEMVRWEVDGTTVDTSGSVGMLVRSGEHRVQAWDARGRLFTALIPVGTEPAFLDEGALRAEGPRIREGHIETADIQRVLTAARPRIQRCYEASITRSSQMVRPPRVRLRLQVGLMGDVTRAQLLDAEAAPADMRSCILSVARGLTFPPPGGVVPPIEQPYTFTARSP